MYDTSFTYCASLPAAAWVPPCGKTRCWALSALLGLMRCISKKGPCAWPHAACGACHWHERLLTLAVRCDRYAGDQLTWLIEKSTGIAPESYLKKLQKSILECDRKGPRNADIPSGGFCQAIRPRQESLQPCSCLLGSCRLHRVQAFVGCVVLLIGSACVVACR